jgi:purine-cytosine permease-like protein
MNGTESLGSTSVPEKVRPTHSSATAIEIHGVESIPDADRDASVLDFVRLCWGGANSIATAVLGAFPIMFGLSFWQATAAAVLGLVIGSVVLAPMSIFGPINGTNNAVSSSAHFGVMGRIIGSFLSLLTAIAFFAISVWSSGDAVMGTAHAVFHVRGTETEFALVYGVFALSVLIVCIYGFKMMLFINKIAVVASTVLFIWGLGAFWFVFDPHFAGARLLWGSARFWAPFISSILIVLANPISFGAFLGDWTRYLPRETSKIALLLATVLAQLLTFLPFLFGIITATVVAKLAPEYLQQAEYTGGLLAVAPHWFLAPLLLLAILSGMSTGTTSLYGTGLDFSSVLPRLSRAQATLFIGTIACMLIFVGRFYFSLFGSISTFVSLIIVTTTPWMVIMMMGYVQRRGYYLPDAMQVFNRRQTGGPYWFFRGWNLAGMSAWVISSVAALLTVNIPGHFVGWLGNLAGGIDISLVVALLLPGLLYPACLVFFPEPKAIYGPAGTRFIPAVDLPLAPIRGSQESERETFNHEAC